MIYFSFLIFLFGFGHSVSTSNKIIVVEKKTYLVVVLTNIKENKGKILIAMHKNGSDFPDNKTRKAFNWTKEASSKQVTLLLGLVPVGKYAISLLHDVNSNKKMDFNLVGLPKEGFGFSNNPKITFKTPSFEKCSFEAKSDTTKLIINLVHL